MNFGLATRYRGPHYNEVDRHLFSLALTYG